MPTLEGASPPTTQEWVAERLRASILSGEYEPGRRLAQSEIASSMKVSITPVREALRDLAMEGLVDIDRFRGAVVHVATLTELEEIFAIRQGLIPLSARLAAEQITETELDGCSAILTQMETTQDEAEWSLLNRRFHGALDAAGRNSYLTEILRRLSDVATVYINLTLGGGDDRRGEADAEHRALLQAHAERDPDRATRLYLCHFEGTLRRARMTLREAEAAPDGAPAA